MQEGILSLMQLPRTVIAAEQVKEAGLPFIVILADPTTGGVSASFAMLGDIAIAEPGAVIGFAGDAGFYYHMAEMETAARAGINAVMVVNNNYSGGVAEAAMFQKEVNFAKVADAMGCAGFRVEKPADIRGALDNALACGKPAIVEIIGNASIRAKRGWAPAGISGE